MKICISVILIGASRSTWNDRIRCKCTKSYLLGHSLFPWWQLAPSFGRERVLRAVHLSVPRLTATQTPRRSGHSTPTVTNVAAPYIMRNVGDVLLDSDALRLLFFQAKHHGAFLHSLRRTKTFWHFFWLQKERSSLHRLLLIPPSQQYPPNNRLDIID